MTTITDAGATPVYECHGHIFMDGEDYRIARERHSDGPDEANVRASLKKLQKAGCIYFRDGGDALGVSLLARELAPEYGIEYVSPAFAIHRRGLYGGIVGKSYSDTKDFRRLVIQLKQAGADFLKLMVSGIITFGRYGELSCDCLPAEETAELIRIAKGEGFSVMVHANGPEAVKASAGADSIEHGYFCDETALEAMARNDCLWVPTLTAVKAFANREGFSNKVAEETVSGQLQSIQDGKKLGITIVPGSDSGAFGVYHGEGIIEEYALLGELGFSHEELNEAAEKLKERFKR